MSETTIPLDLSEARCKKCGKPFDKGEEVIVLVREGGGWRVNAAGESWFPIEEGAELYRIECYHEAHQPATAEGSPDSQ